VDNPGQEAFAALVLLEDEPADEPEEEVEDFSDEPEEDEEPESELEEGLSEEGLSEELEVASTRPLPERLSVR
jgi:hypothetical protein